MAREEEEEKEEEEQEAEEEEEEGRRSRLAASGVAPGVGRRTEGAREVCGFCFFFDRHEGAAG
jgi:hypothetical protein